MYRRVPARSYGGGFVTKAASPRSHILTEMGSPLAPATTRMFPGLMSRCIIRRSCMCLAPPRSCRVMRRTSDSGNGRPPRCRPSLRTSWRLGPTHSMTSATSLVPWLMASAWRLTRDGWPRQAARNSASRSASSAASALALAAPAPSSAGTGARSAFTATAWPVERCRASTTAPKPPSPSARVGS
ncbi:hypothetical protein PAHAL_3G166500 [Panicum hallii]|uniref:Uncharacterized protein n=1 Tax=Panicum hallii TaxID=206008 RepID=A0A2S3H997_9POAL|nr:hypothetical protein PAHAL_3G166500 [Panicum hallii]